MRMTGAYVKLSVLVLAALIASCGNRLLPGGGTADEQNGTLTVSLGAAYPATITPPTDMTMASFDISGSGPEGATFSGDGITGTAFIAENLLLGPWTIEVDAYNGAGTLIMTGSATPTIISGENSVSVDIYPLTGNGTFESSVTWTAGVLTTADTTVVAALTPTAGTSVPLSFTVGDGSASCNQSVPAGYYLWTLQLKESNQLLYQTTPEVVRVIDGQATTAANIDLTALIAIAPTGGSEVPDSTPLLDWFEYPGAENYQIQLSTDETFPSVETTTVYSSEYEVEHALVLNTPHYWRVRPILEGGIAGEWSSPWTFTVVDHIPVDGLVAEYLFDGGSADDTSVNGNNGTVYGAVACVDRFGKTGGALQLDGIDDRIEVPILYPGDQDPVSFTGWVHLTSDSGTSLYAEFTSSSDTRNFFSINVGAQILGFDQFNPTSGAATSGVSNAVQPDVWLFVAITKESDTVDFYINGALISTRTHSETYSGGSPTVAGIGDRYGVDGWEFASSNYNLKGKIDDFRFYNRALTAGEVHDIYTTGGFTPPPVWSRSDGNPVIELGVGGAWDDDAVLPGAVIVEDSLYRMWYSGRDRSTWHIGYATSSDGTTWTRYAGNPVLSGTSGTWESQHTQVSSVIYDDGVFKMWYSGYDGSQWRLGYAESGDGIAWTKHTSNPVLDLGTGWDSANASFPSVIKEGSLYRMWYSGSSGGSYRIGYAESTDGISWTKDPGNPVVQLGSAGTWNSVQVQMPTVVHSGGHYEMWYNGLDSSAYRIGYAYSSDGLNWVTHHLALDVGTSGAWDNDGVGHPVVLNDNGLYRMWYAGSDGFNWRIGYASTE